MEKLEVIGKGYMDWQQKQSDPLTDKYPLMESPSGMIFILLVYFLIIYFAPHLMENRKAFELKRYTMFYNSAQILFCGFYIVRVYQLTETKPDGLYLMCKKWDRNRNAITEEIAFYQYVNFVCRVCELSETIVHILRKKTRQLSYLHVSHHSLNVALSWTTSRFQPGGTSSTICLINFSVHFLMYGYYLMASQENTLLRKIAVWIKMYLTRIQLLQFFYMLVLITMEIMEYPPCRSHTFLTYVAATVLVTNIFLFSNFYYVNYLARRQKTE